MARTHRPYIVVAAVVALISTPLSPVLLASEHPPHTGSEPARTVGTTPAPRSPFTVSDEMLVAASSQWGRRGGRRGRGRHDAAQTAMILGAIGAIAGTAVLVYANRPECRDNPAAGGCGYGTKVLGGAVLAGGAVGLAVGAVTWR